MIRKKSKPADVRCFLSISSSEILECTLGHSRQLPSGTQKLTEYNLDGLWSIWDPGGRDKIEDGSFQAL